MFSSRIVNTAYSTYCLMSTIFLSSQNTTYLYIIFNFFSQNFADIAYASCMQFYPLHTHFLHSMFNITEIACIYWLQLSYTIIWKKYFFHSYILMVKVKIQYYLCKNIMPKYLVITGLAISKFLTLILVFNSKWSIKSAQNKAKYSEFM